MVIDYVVLESVFNAGVDVQPHEFTTLEEALCFSRNRPIGSINVRATFDNDSMVVQVLDRTGIPTWIDMSYVTYLMTGSWPSERPVQPVAEDNKEKLYLGWSRRSGDWTVMTCKGDIRYQGTQYECGTFIDTYGV